MKVDDITVSPACGARHALRLWRVVLAVWIVPLLLAVPGWMIAQGFLGRILGSVPASASVSADVPLIVMEGLHTAGPALLSWIVVSLLALWAWTVAWHAGVASWGVWGAGRPARLGEIAGYGVMRWWRYARLSLTALAGLVVLGAVVTVPLLAAAHAARLRLAETRMVDLQLIAIALALVVSWFCWTATLRGAWELARPGRRSAAYAWLLGLWGAFRQPIRSLGTVLLWGCAGEVLTVAPVLVKLHVAAMRGTAGGFLLDGLLALLAAFCWVALFLSFAPVAGLMLRRREEANSSPARETAGTEGAANEAAA